MVNGLDWKGRMRMLRGVWQRMRRWRDGDGGGDGDDCDGDVVVVAVVDEIVRVEVYHAILMN